MGKTKVILKADDPYKVWKKNDKGVIDGYVSGGDGTPCAVVIFEWRKICVGSNVILKFDGYGKDWIVRIRRRSWYLLFHWTQRNPRMVGGQDEATDTPFGRKDPLRAWAFYDGTMMASIRAWAYKLGEITEK